MGVFDFLRSSKIKAKTEEEKPRNTVARPQNAMTIGSAVIPPPQDDTFKAYIPEFLYKPPFGYPLKKNVAELKLLAQNPYVFSVIRTLKDEAATTKWEIKPKKEFTDVTNPQQHNEEIKRISTWFNNPNGNDESFADILSCWIQDLCELDAAVGVKVFNRGKEFSQLYARDGGTFLKNPDIYGYLGNREEYIDPLNNNFDYRSYTGQDGKPTQEGINAYSVSYSEKAAYFQYGWTGLGLPVPFGRREIIYITMTPRSDSIYGRSPLEILKSSILTLIYGQNYHLDFYLNGNAPDGLISVPGAEQDQVEAMQRRMDSKFRNVDQLGNTVRIGHQYPVTGTDAKFVPFTLSAKDMEIIEQQKWWTKLVWTCFGVPPDEMGFTEDSNKAVSQTQTGAHKRRALTPMLKRIEYAINTQLMPELDPTGIFEFHFEDYNLEEDMKKHQLYQLQTQIGIKTPEMIAEEEGINVEKLKAHKEEERKKRMEETQLSKTPLNEEKQSTVKAQITSLEPEKPQEEKKETNIKPQDAILAYYTKIEQKINHNLDLEEHNLLSDAKVKSIITDISQGYLSFITNEELQKAIQEVVSQEYEKGLSRAEIQFNMNFMGDYKAIGYLKNFGFDAVKNLTEEMKTDLKKTVSLGIMNREDIPQLRDRIQKVMNDSKTRAQLIAQTETIRAFNQGYYDAAKESKLSLKREWSAQPERDENNPCEICESLDGQVVGMNEPFIDKDGKEHFLPPNPHPRCKCRVLYVQSRLKSKKKMIINRLPEGGVAVTYD